VPPPASFVSDKVSLQLKPRYAWASFVQCRNARAMALYVIDAGMTEFQHELEDRP
jgi:hypothetical protein